MRNPDKGKEPTYQEVNIPVCRPRVTTYHFLSPSRTLGGAGNGGTIAVADDLDDPDDLDEPDDLDDPDDFDDPMVDEVREDFVGVRVPV